MSHPLFLDTKVDFDQVKLAAVEMVSPDPAMVSVGSLSLGKRATAAAAAAKQGETTSGAGLARHAAAPVR